MLRPVEREKLQDCLLLIQSARNILFGMRKDLVPDIDEIDRCFQNADQTLSDLLRT
jgi:hypothetical protein